jgi:hypothetical protein
VSELRLLQLYFKDDYVYELPEYVAVKLGVRIYPSLTVALRRSRMYSPARIGGYFEGFSAETQLGRVWKELSALSPSKQSVYLPRPVDRS